MALTVNTNTTASASALNLNKTHSLLQKSLTRLSSGKRINEPADDAGGLAVSVKMSAAIKRTSAVQKNVENAQSFLQTQDGAMQNVGNILDRISELRTLRDDVTKSDTDKANYDTEYKQLFSQLNSIKSEKFNGVTMFGTDLGSVITSEDGVQKVTLSKCTIAEIISKVSGATLGAVAINDITAAINGLATARALNGAQANRLQFANDMLSINKVNLEAANSRIIDTDIAHESTNFVKMQILSQANSAMLAQANSLPQTALRLIG